MTPRERDEVMHRTRVVFVMLGLTLDTVGICVHEAAHAVAVLACGGTVLEVKIGRGDVVAEGWVFGMPIRFGESFGNAHVAYVECSPLAGVFVALAGPAATLLWTLMLAALACTYDVFMLLLFPAIVLGIAGFDYGSRNDFEHAADRWREWRHPTDAPETDNPPPTDEASMREQIFDRLDTDEPDAPENCVVCKVSLDPEGTGTIEGFEGDGCTCSAPCHATHLQRQAEHAAEERAANDALCAHWQETERLRG